MKEHKTRQILQITDLHLFGDDNHTLMGLQTSNTLEAVLNSVKLNMANGVLDPSCIVLSGDISQDYSLASYQKVLNYFDDFTCPIYALLGNHDNSYVFENAFLHSKINLDKKVILGNWLILLLNSHVPFQVGGHLSDGELSFLESELAANQDKFVLIFVHHHLLPCTALWLNKIDLANKERLFSIIDKYNCVVGVSSGHIHQNFHEMRNNVDYFTTPSTCLQFAENTENFKADVVMPGYRWFSLDSDGSCTSGIVRVAHEKSFVPDLFAKGY